MKVAVATANGQVSEHFGPAPGFTIATVEPDGVKNVEYIKNLGGDCQAIPIRLAGMGVQTAIVGGIGSGAVANLQQQGIDVIGSASGSIETVLEEFRKGTIVRGNVGCDAHGEEHKKRNN